MFKISHNEMLGGKHILDKLPDFKKKISNESLVKGSSHLPGRKKHGLPTQKQSMLEDNEACYQVLNEGNP